MNLSHIKNPLNHKKPTMTTRYAQMLDTTGGDELKKCTKVKSKWKMTSYYVVYLSLFFRSTPNKRLNIYHIYWFKRLYVLFK